MFDGEAFGAEIVEAVRGFVERAIAPFRKEIAELRDLLIEKPLTREEVQRLIKEAVAAVVLPGPELIVTPFQLSVEDREEIRRSVAEAVAALPAPSAGAPGVDGKDADPVSAEQIASAVAAWLEANPPVSGKDGRDGADGTDGADGADGARGLDGKDADPVSAEQISAAVTAWLEANPPASGRDGRDGVDGKDGTHGVRGEDGADGIGLAGALIDREGGLVVTLTNGEQRALGLVVGRDGVDGQPGKDGAPGADGLGFEDLAVDFDGERTIGFSFARGEQVKAFDMVLPIVIDRGVYRADGAYVQGDGVTWAGSYWIAQRDTSSKPETCDDWRLAVKRGRDGRDGKDGDMGLPGPKGDPGLNGRA